MADRLTTKEALVLVLLGDEERYGLDLVRSSDGALRRGLVYVTLARMEERGLLTSRLDDEPSERTGRRRRLYTALPMGKQALEHHEPQGPDDIPMMPGSHWWWFMTIAILILIVQWGGIFSATASAIDGHRSAAAFRGLECRPMATRWRLRDLGWCRQVLRGARPDHYTNRRLRRMRLSVIRAQVRRLAPTRCRLHGPEVEVAVMPGLRLVCVRGGNRQSQAMAAHAAILEAQATTAAPSASRSATDDPRSL